MARSISVLAVVAALTAPAAADELTLTIDQAIGRVEPAAGAIAAAREEEAGAAARVEAARAGRLPQVSATAAYQRTILSEFAEVFGDLPFGQANAWRLGVNVTQPIWDGGRTKTAVAVAKLGVDISRVGIAGTRGTLVMAVAQAYWDAALAVRAVEIGQAALASAEETLAQTKLSYDHQAAAEFDVVRAQVARDNQATGLIQLGAQRDIAMATLARLIDAPLDQPISLATRLEGDDGAAISAIARSQAGMVADQPAVDVALAETTVKLREATLHQLRAQVMPSLAASTDFGLVDYPEDIHPFNADWRTNWTVGVGISIPLFDGFRARALERAAKRDIAAARARLTDVKEQVAVSARIVDAQLAAATATWEQARRTVEQAQRAYAIAELRFAQGASTHLELVDARTQLEQAELNRARSARDGRVATLRRDLLAGLPLGAGGP